MSKTFIAIISVASVGVRRRCGVALRSLLGVMLLRGEMSELGGEMERARAAEVASEREVDETKEW